MGGMIELYWGLAIWLALQLPLAMIFGRAAQLGRMEGEE
jgi:hypothetical protein